MNIFYNKKMKSKYFTALLIGIFLGFVLGTWFYSSVLDKPEIVQKIGKQKVKGKNNKIENKQEEPKKK